MTIEILKLAREALVARLADLDDMISGLDGHNSKAHAVARAVNDADGEDPDHTNAHNDQPRGRRPMSAAARKRISAAQKRIWKAKKNAAGKQGK